MDTFAHLSYALGGKFVQAALTHHNTMFIEMSVVNYLIKFNQNHEVQCVKSN